MDINRLYELSEKADKILQSDGDKEELNSIIDELKPIIAEIKKGSIGIAQINTIPGDIEYNAKKIVKYITYAEKLGLELVLFPEYALTGFPLEDAIERFPIIGKETYKWLNEIAKYTKNTVAIVGALDTTEIVDSCDMQVEEKYNESILAVLKEGNFSGIIKKIILPDNPIEKDYKYMTHGGYAGYFEFTEGSNRIDEIINIDGLKYSISNDYAGFMEKKEYRSTFEADKDKKPDIYINCSATTSYKDERALDSCKKYPFIYRKLFVYVNQVGAVDSLSFDGASSVFDGYGKLIARAKSYKEQFFIVNPTKEIGKIYPSPDDSIKQDENIKFSLNYENCLEKTYEIVIQGIKDYFSKNGIKHACLGLSGGLDSTVCAVLLTDALGKENVAGVSMPSKITTSESRSDAEKLASNLGINYFEMPIKEVVDTTDKVLQEMFANIEKNWKFRYKKSFTMDNIQARTRAVYLWGIANEFESCIPIATSDKSELYMGYATINGDMSGGYAPIADITKTKLFALARWLNKNRPQKDAIPESIINKRPGAELTIDERTGKPLCAEDALMPYEFMDEVIWRLENKQESYKQMLDSLFVYEKEHNISKEQKKEWLDKFFKRMFGATFKGTLMPPSIIVERPTINKYDFRCPISSKINVKELTEDEIRKKLLSSII